MPRLRLPSVRQLDLLFGRRLTMPDGEIIDGDTITLGPVEVELSPRQALWMGLDPPKVASCPGCVLFGCCALHDEETDR